MECIIDRHRQQVPPTSQGQFPQYTLKNGPFQAPGDRRRSNRALASMPSASVRIGEALNADNKGPADEFSPADDRGELGLERR